MKYNKVETRYYHFSSVRELSIKLILGIAGVPVDVKRIAHEQMRNDKTSFQSHYYHSADW